MAADSEDFDALINIMMRSRDFSSPENLEIYYDAMERLFVLHEAAALSQPQVEALLLCMTDSEFGGHGVMERLSTYLFGCRRKILEDAYLKKFLEMPELGMFSQMQFMGLLLDPDVWHRFFSYYKSKSKDEFSKARGIVFAAFKELGWQVPRWVDPV